VFQEQMYYKKNDKYAIHISNDNDNNAVFQVVRFCEQRLLKDSEKYHTKIVLVSVWEKKVPTEMQNKNPKNPADFKREFQSTLKEANIEFEKHNIKRTIMVGALTDSWSQCKGLNESKCI